MKLITTVTAAFAVSFAGSATLAQGNNYIVFSAMYSAPLDSDFSIGEDLTGELGMKGGAGFVLAFGHKFSNGLALEAEVSSKGSKAKSITFGQDRDIGPNPDTDPDDRITAGTSYPVTPQVKITTTALMANGVFRTNEVGSGLRPYLGAGLGVSNVKIRNLTVTVSQDASVNVSGARDSAVAYQFLGGVDVPLTEATSARIGYRYFATGSAEFATGSADVGKLKIKTRSHNLELGFVFEF
ncbi:MAG: outer membrane beta-barrel protein [Rhodobacteraceae bacterium]|nr:outer membrane beta-barrel protein [Paracoccaceae bacterium]